MQFRPRELKAGQQTPLDVYVNTPDSHYSWVDTGIVYKKDGFTTYILNMTSQQWLTSNGERLTTGPAGKSDRQVQMFHRQPPSLFSTRPLPFFSLFFLFSLFSI